MPTLPRNPALLAALAAVTVLTLSACGGGGGGDEAPPAASQPPATALGCAANSVVALPGGGELMNNAWNVAAAGGFAWSQCLQQRRLASGATENGWAWRWPDNGTQVYSYPSISIGAKPWLPGPGNDARFPRRIADTPRLLLSAEVESTFSGNANFSASMWFTRTASAPAVPVEADISAELMIWSDYTPALVSNAAAVTERGQVTLEGRLWRVFAASSWGDASGASSHRWAFIIYVPVERSQTLNVDARRFIDDAVARGLLDPTHAVANVELGNEISSGSGTTWVRSFRVTVP